MNTLRSALLLAGGLYASVCALAQIPLPSEYRGHAQLNDNWLTFADEDPKALRPNFESPTFDDSDWRRVSVPHNWDGYEGFRQAKHGPLHGRAWYRNHFSLSPDSGDKRAFLFFEGVGSYAKIWINGQFAGEHAGGLTSFNLDISDFVHRDGQPNLVAVQADHPAGIRDLPWVCGGCELAYGFSEGTQPFGIFRPVHLVTTHSLRIAPFGIHAWNLVPENPQLVSINVTTELLGQASATIRHTLLDREGATVATASAPASSEAIELRVSQPILWHPDHPYLYTLRSNVIVDGETVDQLDTPYGIRWVEWPDLHGPPHQPLKINGEPYFLNGVADYEHLLGQSHAFSNTQVKARVRQIQAAGFNAFRDAHHPHNLRFNQHWDSEGMFWWTQFGAHIWFENESFYANYKSLLRDWIKERRNSPSLMLYGLQNESKLPRWFAEECAAIIREMDPTASSQRPITTCNGGVGTDWDVPQNWSGTYGGNLQNYANELLQQRMVGEYGAWRSIDLHSEGGYIEDGPLSEDRMTALMETKLRLAHSVRDRAIGHFAWPMTTHQNPGRNVGSLGQQTTDGIRALDQIGPANNKGLQTIWGEPLDVFYMYRSHFAPAATEPMVYIVSHTWPDRWTSPGTKDGIIVYSNCDEVELFNDLGERSLGTRQKGPHGTHFRWDGADIRYNVLHARGRIDGKVVARDTIILHHLPPAPAYTRAAALEPSLTVAAPGLRYLHRVNCGGPDFVDTHGYTWNADRPYEPGESWGSLSWGARFANLLPEFGSKRRSFDPVSNARDDLLFQSYRYGREELQFRFDLPNGEYLVELYFVEPWFGPNLTSDASGWRVFDVAINDQVVLPNLDIWSQAGRMNAIKRSVPATVVDGSLRIHFPKVASGQAVISAIAIASRASGDATPQPSASLTPLVASLGHGPYEALTWLDTGLPFYANHTATLSDLSYELRESEWIRLPHPAKRPSPSSLQLATTREAEIFAVVAPDSDALSDPWERTALQLSTSDHPETALSVYRRRIQAGQTTLLDLGSGQNALHGLILKRRYPPAPAISVSDLSVHSSAAPAAWQTIANLRAGVELYSDGGPALASFHARLSDCDWLRGPQTDAANPDLRLSFRVQDHTEVYLALDPRIASKPDWLKNWIQTDFFIQPIGGERHLMLKRRYRPGDTVELGPNARLPDDSPAQLYSVVVRSVRESFTSPLDAIDPATGAGSWSIYVGVGDRYGLNIPYNTESGDTTPATLTIIASDGSIVCQAPVSIPPAPAATGGETLRLRTCKSINAGNYTIHINPKAPTSIAFGPLELE